MQVAEQSRKNVKARCSPAALPGVSLRRPRQLWPTPGASSPDLLSEANAWLFLLWQSWSVPSSRTHSRSACRAPTLPYAYTYGGGKGETAQFSGQPIQGTTTGNAARSSHHPGGPSWRPGAVTSTHSARIASFKAHGRAARERLVRPSFSGKEEALKAKQLL